jgi:hypothetical protein
MTTVVNRKFIRLTQVGGNKPGNDTLTLHALEFSGAFDEPSVTRTGAGSAKYPGGGLRRSWRVRGDLN